MDEDLLPIGRFARLSRLSIKQLRHYADLGLLIPAYVDEQTGYRYYRRDQARDALAIGLLRSLDVPLGAIPQVLSGHPGALEGVHDRLDAELARRRSALAALRRVMAEGLPAASVRIVDEPPRRVAVVTESAADPSDIGRATAVAVARLRAEAPPGATEFVGLFPLDLGEPTTVTVALVTAATVSGAGVDVLPGGKFAAVTHVGPYDQIGLTAPALLSWCAEQRHQLRGPMREVYVSDPSTTASERLVTHLMIPLEET